MAPRLTASKKLRISLLFVFWVTCRLNAGDVMVSWNPNSEPDLLGYKIYYGTVSHQYSHILDVGNTTSYVVSNLMHDMQYYFALTAYDVHGNESDFSIEVSAYIPPLDTIPPYVTSIEVVDETRIDLIFNESINPVSAENKENYQINHNIVIYSAVLDENHNVVHLHTSFHQPGQYMISVSHIQDNAQPPNEIAPNSFFNYQVLDTSPPEISQVIAIDKNKVDVTFTEPVQESSAENILNYVINNGIHVQQAVLDENQTTVHLTTSIHDEDTYIITINNIKDRAANPNPINPNSQFEYQYRDMIPPTILNVETTSDNQLDITFDEPVEESSAEETSNYSIHPNIDIIQAELDIDQMRVHLTTDKHPEGTYTLTVNNVRDQALNPNTILPGSSVQYEYVDRTPPVIVDVQAPAEDTVIVEFSEPIDEISAVDVNNYHISGGIVVNEAVLDGNKKTVYLSTSQHIEGVYSVFVSNITDRANTPNPIDVNSRFDYDYIDHVPPQIVSVQALVDNQVDVKFNESLEPISAENILNYQINQGISIYSAILDNNNNTVHLLTSKHVPGTYYLSVNYVKDNSSQHNEIQPNTQMAYEYIDLIPPTVINVFLPDENHVDVTFSEPVDQASAENLLNYDITNGIVIYSIELDENGLVAHLETSSHLPGSYTLQVTNIKDRAVNANMIEGNFSFDYFYVDRTPPVITDAKAVNDTLVEVTFSETVEQNSAENLQNYQISDGIVVLSARLKEEGKAVQLSTSQHQAGQYTIIINNIKDRAATPNTIAPDSRFVYEYLDQTPPAITDVIAADEFHVNVIFSERVDRMSAEYTGNYEINKGITIESAVLDEDGIIVHLTTSSHIPGSYRIVVNNIQDRALPPNNILPDSYFDYEYVDRTPPTMVNVQAVDENHVDITFSELVERQSAENNSNYLINGNVQVNGALLDENGFVVHLTTTSHEPGQYTVTVSNVKDRASNPNKILPGSQFSYEYVDSTPPYVINVNADSEDSVSVTFSEPVERISAETVANYTINKGIQVFDAHLDDNRRTVHLNTSLHEEDRYTLTVQHVTDMADVPNEVPENMTFQYDYVDVTPPQVTLVQVVSETLIQVNFSERIEKSSAETVTNYQINNNIQIVAAVLDETQKIVELSTSAHGEGNYILTVNNITDQANQPNVIDVNAQIVYSYVDTAPPEVISVVAVSDSMVNITFNEPVEEVSAENKSNYEINQGINIYQAVLDANLKTVHLMTSPHTERTYDITILGVKDRALTPNQILAEIHYQYQYIDTFPPEIVSVAALSEDIVSVEFSEPVNRATAEQTANYHINGGIEINGAELDGTEKVVLLETSAHLEGDYIITISDIQDQASTPNMILPGSTFQYEYIDSFPPLIVGVDVVNIDKIKVTFNEPIEKLSAERVSNYLINPDIAIFQAVLADDQVTVELRTAPHQEGIYTLVINNVRDRANNPNPIARNSSIQYQCIDTTPPVITEVLAIKEDSVIIVFSEPVDRVTSENKGNYFINNNIQIYKATLGENLTNVHLSTSPHEEGSYVITINNIKDRASTPNTIEQNTVFEYQYIDTTPPTIVGVEAVADSQINVTFSEPVTKAPAENVSNYTISQGISIYQAILDEDLITVHLKTSTHREGTYVLSVTGVTDRANRSNPIIEGNAFEYVYVDHIPPQVTNVTAISDTSVDIVFTEPIERLSAENINNYEIGNGIRILSAKLDQDTITVHLITSSHSEGNYTISISNIKDKAQIPNLIAQNTVFSYEYIDQIRPVIENVEAINPQQVDITFSEAMEKSSAEDINNYQINNGIVIQQASLDENGRTVHLSTTTHQPGNYILVVNNVFDRASTPNAILSHSYWSYQFEDQIPPEITRVEVLDASHLRVSFSERVDKHSAEDLNNYVIGVDENYIGNNLRKNKTGKEIVDDHFILNNKTIYLSQTISIHSLSLESNERFVHILTDEHQPGTYVLVAENIKDKAEQPNIIQQNSRFVYQFEDRIPPQVENVEIIDRSHVDVYFSEEISFQSAVVKENYVINNGIQVLEVQLDENKKIAHLTTSSHQNGRIYSLTINNITDLADNPNVILPNTTVQYVFIESEPEKPGAITLRSVESDGNGGIVVRWEPAVENNILGYKVYYGTEPRSYDTILDVGKVHSSTISSLIEGVEYYFSVTAYDNMGLESDFSNELSCVVEVIDLEPPEVFAANALSDTVLVVVFNEEIEESSAENVNNFRINKGIEVIKATLYSNGRMVQLTTTPHLPDEYTLTLNNIKDIAPNPNAILPNTQYTYRFYPNDKIAPFVVDFKLISKNKLDIHFSEYIDRLSGENLNNYSIDHGVIIHSAVLDTNNSTIHLTTSDHVSGLNYTLSLSDIRDCALPPNFILPDTRINYTYWEEDTKAPEIYSVMTKAENVIEVLFSERVQQPQAESVANYFINNGVEIATAELKQDGKTVVLQTTPHQIGMVYILGVKDILDYADPPNKIKTGASYRYVFNPRDSEPPVVVSVNALDATLVEIVFSEFLDRKSAETVANYRINKDIVVLEARLTDEPNIVHLVTSSHLSGETYTLSVTQIKDTAPRANIIQSEIRMDYVYSFRDNEPPIVESCYLKNTTQLLITFNEIIERESAENIQNYQINNGVEIYEALLDSSLKTVVLTTSEHDFGQNYSIKINNIRDRANPPNVLIDVVEINYSFQENLNIIVDQLTPSDYKVAYVGVGDHYYIDRDYKIKKLPIDLMNCLWIKTAQNDAGKNNNNFLSFQLKGKGKIYIGFDHRAKNYPEWLVNKFYRNGKRIEVDDELQWFDVWEMEADSGMIVLGGNQASGAEDVQAMYVVVIQTEQMNQLPMPDGAEDPVSREIVKTYHLFQNYPNPFNGDTNLQFFIPQEAYVEIKVYNLLGQLVTALVDEEKSPGKYLISWNGKNSDGYSVSSGIYFTRMVVREIDPSGENQRGKIVYSRLRKMLVVR